MIGRALPSGRTAGAEGGYTNSLMATYIKRNYYTATSLLVVLLSGKLHRGWLSTTSFTPYIYLPLGFER